MLTINSSSGAERRSSTLELKFEYARVSVLDISTTTFGFKCEIIGAYRTFGGDLQHLTQKKEPLATGFGLAYAGINTTYLNL